MGVGFSRVSVLPDNWSNCPPEQKIMIVAPRTATENGLFSWPGPSWHVPLPAAVETVVPFKEMRRRRQPEFSATNSEVPSVAMLVGWVSVVAWAM